MLTRRHIRVKVMQCIYALTHTKDNSLKKQEEFLETSMDNMYTLYLLMISIFREFYKTEAKQVTFSSKRYIKTPSDAYPDRGKFLKNKVLLQMVENAPLRKAIADRNLEHWHMDHGYAKLIHKEITDSAIYDSYMSQEVTDYSDDKQVLIDLFREIIAPNERIYEYLEDRKLTWVDDIPIVNTFILKLLKKVSPTKVPSFFLPKLLKDPADMDFARQLLTKTLLDDAQWTSEIARKTPNWDKDRIADVDGILLKMAICELLNFPTIPEKVTINEFLEIAKEYSTPKSSIFINGILDKLVKEYRNEGKLNKSGRGLL